MKGYFGVLTEFLMNAMIVLVRLVGELVLYSY